MVGICGLCYCVVVVAARGSFVRPPRAVIGHASYGPVRLGSTNKEHQQHYHRRVSFEFQIRSGDIEIRSWNFLLERGRDMIDVCAMASFRVERSSFRPSIFPPLRSRVSCFPPILSLNLLFFLDFSRHAHYLPIPTTYITADRYMTRTR